MNVGPRYELISIIKEIEIIFKDEQGNIVFEKTVSNEALNQKYKKIKIQTSYNQGLNLNKNSLINKDVYQEMRKIIGGESHGDDGNLEGMGLIYYSIVNLLRPKNVLCIGSGDGYIPCIMRQSQRDLNIDGKTFLVDADLPEVGYGGPAYLEKNSALRTAYPEIEIITEMSDKAYENIFKYIELDYIHIDADHSYEGVKSDFYNYVNLTRDAFIHDPESLSRYPVILRPIITFMGFVFFTPRYMKSIVLYVIVLFFCLSISIRLIRLYIKNKNKSNVTINNLNNDIYSFLICIFLILFFIFTLPNYSNAKYYIFLLPFFFLISSNVVKIRNLFLFNIFCNLFLIFQLYLYMF